METTEETLIADEFEREEDTLMKESWPLPPDDYVREFEEYLMDIGLRF